MVKSKKMTKKQKEFNKDIKIFYRLVGKYGKQRLFDMVFDIHSQC